jgi:hypothetical protein
MRKMEEVLFSERPDGNLVAPSVSSLVWSFYSCGTLNGFIFCSQLYIEYSEGSL